MDLLNSQLTAIYTIIGLLVIWMLVYWCVRTRRSRQWLIQSAFASLALIPMIGILLAPEELDAYTILPGNWSIIEAGLVSGLLWSITATGLIAIKAISPAKSPIKFQWLRIGLTYLLLWLTMLIAGSWSIPTIIALVCIVGIGSVLLSIWDQRLLLLSFASGAAVLVTTVILAIVFSYLSPALDQFDLPATSLTSILPIPAIVLTAMLAMSAPIVTRWWFRQSLHRRAE